MKYAEQQKAIGFANTLKDLNIGITELNKLNFILDDSYINLFSEVSENNLNEDLFSIIAYLKSAVSANIRMIEENSSVIEGTISPSFLAGKTFFIFQEDFIVDMQNLRNNISSLEAEAAKNNLIQDTKLINYIKNSTEDTATFDKLYSFYIPLEDFRRHIEEMTSPFYAEDCSDNCIIGCGTDLGCCSNYTGCCYYSSLFCHWHDLECVNCDKWHCGPLCKPDTRPNRAVKLYLSLI